MVNRRYTEKLKIRIECKDDVLPAAICQAGNMIQIQSSGSDIKLGMQQLMQPKNLDMLPLTSRPMADVPLLPNGKRINQG